MRWAATCASFVVVAGGLVLEVEVEVSTVVMLEAVSEAVVELLADEGPRRGVGKADASVRVAVGGW